MEYWEKRYREGSTGWDIGYPTPALCKYFNQLEDKSTKILIPGAGNAYEASYLHQHGFDQVYIIDIAPSPLNNFAQKHPDFPKERLINGDFFEHKGNYELIMEQTFFCAIDPSLRAEYAKKSHELLADQGKLVGLLWSEELNQDQPPYGGSKAEYYKYFDPYFEYRYFEAAKDSIPQRQGREYFLLAQKK